MGMGIQIQFLRQPCHFSNIVSGALFRHFFRFSARHVDHVDDDVDR